MSHGGGADFWSLNTVHKLKVHAGCTLHELLAVHVLPQLMMLSFTTCHAYPVGAAYDTTQSCCILVPFWVLLSRRPCAVAVGMGCVRRNVVPFYVHPFLQCQDFHTDVFQAHAAFPPSLFDATVVQPHSVCIKRAEVWRTAGCINPIVMVVCICFSIQGIASGMGLLGTWVGRGCQLHICNAVQRPPAAGTQQGQRGL